MVQLWPAQDRAAKAFAAGVDTGQRRSSANPRTPRDFAIARIGNGRASAWLGSNGQPASGYFIHPVCPRSHSIEFRKLQKRMAARHLRFKTRRGAQSDARESRESVDCGNAGGFGRDVSLSFCVEI